MKKIFIDTDMGLDDIIAIAMLISSGLEITGISTVNGVSAPQVGAKNIKKILDYLGIDIPICVGEYQKVSESMISFPSIDRKRAENLDFLDYLDIKINTVSDNRNIEDFIYESLAIDTTLVCLGPLTNIAKTLVKYGSLFEKKVKRIYIMGGGIKYGNVPGKLVEYNIALDPEAAKIIFKSKIPACIVGIDATRNVPAGKDLKKMIERVKTKNKLSKIIKDVIIKNKSDFIYFYDPLLSSIVIDSSIIKKAQEYILDLILKGKERGRTRSQKTQNGNIQAITEVNPNSFYKLLFRIITR